MKSAADATASSACSGLDANRTSLPSPFRNWLCKCCLSSADALAGSRDEYKTAIPAGTRNARTVAIAINGLRCRPLIKLITNLLLDNGFADQRADTASHPEHGRRVR